ncbi:pol [Symbiodinium sp. CCMP2592]|nr:pol [Symbiodinium sp. CCMP2592]
MAPASSGARRPPVCHDILESDLLGGPLARLQELTFFGLWGENEKGQGLQEPALCFTAVVGDGGKLLKASDTRARQLSAWKQRLPRSPYGLDLWVQASRRAWQNSWTLSPLWHAVHSKVAETNEAQSDTVTSVHSEEGNSSSNVPGTLAGNEAGNEGDCAFGCRAEAGGEGVDCDLRGFSCDSAAYCWDGTGGDGVGREYPQGPEISSPASVFQAGLACHDDCCDFDFDFAIACSAGSDGKGVGRECPKGPEISSPELELPGLQNDGENLHATRSHAGCFELVSEIPRPPAQDLHLVIEAEALMRATSVMRGKAGGADGWLPSDLLQLPIAWFRWAAALWNRILATGKVPAQWRKARVALLWKKRRRTRPITLLCSLWRAGARVIQTQLGPWVASWADHTAAGGLPGTSVQAALMQIRKAMTDGAVAFIQSDIKSYFDSIHIGAMQRALTHMRFPQPVLAVLTDFYNGAERIFSLSGSLNPSWSSVSSGIAQGCPLSPVIAALLSYLWSTFVIGNSSRSLGALAYIDDRTVWAKAGAPTDSLRDAMARSSAYDRAFGLRLSVDKCSVVAPTLGPELRALAAELEFQVMPDLEILGVRATFRGEWTLLKYHARKAILRARLLGWCTRNTDHQKFLLASLVVPPFAWASGFARCDRDDLTAIKADIENVFNHGFTAGFAKVCLYEAIGWNLQPDFACDLGALRVLWKASIQQPRWLDTVALSEAHFRWRTMLPELPEVLRKLDWKVDFASTEVCRTDRSGRVRTLRPGIDGFCVVKDWLVQHFRQLYVARTGRVQRRLHRDDESLAVGLDLPAPGRHQDYYFDGLHTAISMGLRSVTLSALGAGSSCWHFNAGGNFDATHDRWRCLCGLRAPSRAHLLWNCEKTATLREGLQLPVDRCEERLLLRGAPEQPPPPPAVAPQECFDDLVEAIDTQLSLDPAVLFVATDGSEDKKVGAFAVAVHPGDFVCALGTADEDQSPFKQELLGFDFAAKALLKVAARSLWARRVVFVLDCQSALTLVLQKGDSFCYYLKIVDSIKASLRALRGHGVAVTCVWVPSHGKRPGWHAPPGLCGDLLRKLNASADEAAGACRLRRFSGGAIEAWWLHRNDARSWELRAIQASAASGEALHRELRRHGLRPRERAPDDGAVVPPLGSDFGGADPSLAAGGQSS